MFEGFTLERIDVGDAELRVRHGGSGPAVLLLHGHPRTHVTWHKVAPVLAERFTVVCPDLRGYGESSKPPTTPGRSTAVTTSPRRPPPNSPPCSRTSSPPDLTAGRRPS
jgi:haloacetate dehalogenase